MMKQEDRDLIELLELFMRVLESDDPEDKKQTLERAKSSLSRIKSGAERRGTILPK